MNHDITVIIAELLLLEIGASFSLLYLLPALWRAGRSQIRLKLAAVAVLTYPILVVMVEVAIEWWIAWPHLGDARYILAIFLPSILFAFVLREISGASTFLFAGCAASAVAMTPILIAEHMNDDLIYAQLDIAFLVGFVLWNVVVAAWAVIWSTDDRNKWVRSHSEFCRCGYDLVGLPGPRCPECGASITQSKTANH